MNTPPDRHLSRAERDFQIDRCQRAMSRAESHAVLLLFPLIVCAGGILLDLVTNTASQSTMMGDIGAAAGALTVLYHALTHWTSARKIRTLQTS